MKSPRTLIATTSLLFALLLICNGVARSQSVLVSEYYNDQPPSEWNEIIVVQDNLDMRGFIVSDNNTAQVTRQGGVKFKNIDFWKNVRAGTIIGIWHRDYPANDVNNRDTSAADGRLMLAKNDTDFFEPYKSSASIQTDAPFNLAIDGDIIEVLDAAGNHIHGVGHRVVDPAPGTYWIQMSDPKMNTAVSLQNGQSNRVFPGSKLSEYNAPNGAPFTQACATNITRTLPNKDCNSANSNWAFWHELRRPAWVAPTLNAAVSASQVNLSWNSINDPNPQDNRQGYMVVRDSGSTPSLPVDGRSYQNGDKIGNAVVLAHLSSTQTTYTDNFVIPCGAIYIYRVYAYRFTQDEELGNGANPQTTRGRQYNTVDVATSAPAIKPAPQGPKLSASGATSFCAGGSVVISVPVQNGLQPQWMLNGGDLTGEVTFSTTAKVSGEYRLKLRDVNGCLALTDSIIVTVYALPVVDINPKTYNLCKDSTALLSATENTDFRYQWLKDGQPINGATQSTLLATGTGNYSVSVTDGHGCTNSSPVATVSPISANFSLSVSSIQYRDLAGCENSLDSSMTLTNSGTQSLIIEKVTEPTGFRLVSPATPFEVKPGEKRTVVIRFAPEIQGTASGAMDFVASPCGASSSLQLKGSKPDIVGVRSLSTAVDFGTLVRCQSTEKIDSIIIIYSAENSAYLEKPLLAAPFQVDESKTSFPVTLKKDSLQKIYIKFSAQADIPVSRDLKIPYRTQSCSDTLRISVRGSMTTPNVDASLLSLRFPPLDSCKTLERDTTITLVNTSTVDVTINQLAQPFLQIIKPLPNPTLTIKARDSIVLTLRFTTPGYTTVSNQFIQFTGQPCLNSSAVQINGERQGASFALDATELDFGDIVRCNSSQISRQFNINTNATTAGLAQLSALQFSKGGYALNLQRFQQLSNGQTNTIVTLTPSSSAPLGNFSDTLDLLFAPCDISRRVVLKGRYIDPDVRVSPGLALKVDTLRYGTIDANTTLTRQSVIRNTGSTPIQTASLLSGILPPFSATAVPPLGSTLAPGEEMTITITYAPKNGSKDNLTVSLPIIAPCADTISITVEGEARVLDTPVRPFFLKVDYGYHGKPGDKISVKVNMNGTDITDSDLRYLECILTYNKSMLYPLSIQSGAALQTHTARLEKVSTGLKLIAENGTKVSSEGEAFIVDFEVLLGDAMQTPLALDTNTIILTSDNLIRGDVQSGSFTLEGVCNVDKRLLKVEGKVLLALLSSNPVSGGATVSYETVGEQFASLELFNSVGERVSVIHEGITKAGVHTAEIPAFNITQGSYFLILRSGISTKNLRFDVVR